MRHPNVEIMLSSMMGKLTGYCKCQGVEWSDFFLIQNLMLCVGGARLAAEEREEMTNRDGVASGGAT